MKKKLLVLVCAFCALTASAQRASSSSSSFFSTEKADGGVTFGIRAGVNFAKITASDNDGNSFTPDSRTSFHVGVIADIPLMESLYVQTGLFLQNKGYKYEESREDYKSEETAKPMYLEIPVLASYRYNFSDALQLQVNFGPYFGYGIGGKVKNEWSGYGYSDEEEVDFFGDNDDDDTAHHKRFNCGLQIGAGVTLSDHYYLGFAYQFGLTNIYDTRSGSDYKEKDKNWMISLGYNF